MGPFLIHIKVSHTQRFLFSFSHVSSLLLSSFLFSVTRISYKNADTSPPLRTLRRRPASAGEGYCASLPASIVQVAWWGVRVGSWAGLGGGAHRPSGWLDIARWSRRIDLHHRVRLVWGIAPMDGGRGRRCEGWRGGQARSCPSRWGWCWRGGAAPSGLLGRASASGPHAEGPPCRRASGRAPAVFVGRRAGSSDGPPALVAHSPCRASPALFGRDAVKARDALLGQYPLGQPRGVRRRGYSPGHRPRDAHSVETTPDV